MHILPQAERPHELTQRNKAPKNRSAAQPVSTDENAQTSTIELGRDVTVSRPLKAIVVVVIVALLWWSALASLAIFTANPIVLNLAQITQADFVVSGLIVDLETGKVQTEKEWRLGIKLDVISVQNLKNTDVVEGGRYLIPLTKRRDGYVVTQASLPIRQRIPEGIVFPSDGVVIKGKSRIEFNDKRFDVGPGDHIARGSLNLKNEIVIQIDQYSLGTAFVYPDNDESQKQLTLLLEQLKKNAQ
jgi:hypothetical protein